MVFTAITIFRCNALNAIPLKSILINNRECKISINSNEPSFYPYSVLVNKYSGSCNNINDPYATLCVPDVVKDVSIKLFNLMSRANETRYIFWHEICKCRLDASVCNDKECWNNDKCRCECKELIDKRTCDK